MGRYSLTSVFIVAACLLAGLRAQAQEAHQGESFTLDAPLSSGQSHIYVAGDRIGLLPGFRSEPQRYRRTELWIDPYGVFPPEEGLTGGPHVQDQGVVGALGGTVDVGAMGAAVYTIPLDLPAGINGMRPSLAVTYNSQAGNGLMGWGWDLAGLSAIERTGRTLYHDGETTAADLSSKDCFLLDGKRLVKVAEGSSIVEYRTEQDEMSKIESYITFAPTGLSLARVISHFKIWKADGLILEYGNSESSYINAQNGSPKALCWLLNKISDRHGNSVLYHYHEDVAQGEFHIDTILYTVNEGQGTPAQFAVTFEYERSRHDEERHYIGGNQLYMGRLLTDIKVVSKTDGRPLFQYSFTYNDEYVNGRKYHTLASIVKKAFDADGTVESVNPTTVTWCNASPTALVPYPLSTPGIFSDFPFTGDFNGDGYTDVALVPYKDSAAYHSPVDIRVYLNDRVQGFEHVASMDVTGVPSTLDWIHVLDINDDGLDDLVPLFYDTMPSSGTESTTVKVYLNQPSDRTFHYIGGKTVPDKADVVAGDFDGNGTRDVVILQKLYSEADCSNPKIIPFLENAFHLGFSESLFHVTQLNDPSLESLGPVFNPVAGDFDGDGVTELLLVGGESNGTCIGRFDFGDSQECFKIGQRLSQGPYPLQSECYSSHWCYVFPGDYNGDGKTDLLYLLENEWKISLSEGGTMGTPLSIRQSLPNLNSFTNMFYPSLQQLNQAMQYNYTATMVTGDFDGDGSDDICFTRTTNSKLYFKMGLFKISATQVGFRKGIDHQNSIVFSSLFIHAGNFLGRDNLSILGSAQPQNGTGSPVLGIHSLNSVGQFNSVVGVTDGLGNTTSFTYDWLMPKAGNEAEPFYACSHEAPDTHGISPVPLPVIAMKTCRTEGANGSTEIVRYRYRNAMHHRHGHGFLGFEETIAETFRNSTETPWRTRVTRRGETSTMGRHAAMLPQSVTRHVNSGSSARTVDSTRFAFENAVFSSATTDLVVCPAMTGRTVWTYSTDRDGELTSTAVTEYRYDYGADNTYSNAYGCVSSIRTVTGYRNGTPRCELQTDKITGLQTFVSSWIVNRPYSETVTKTRDNGSVSSQTAYSYASNDTYRPRTVTVVPNDGSDPLDPLTLSTQYGYDGYGNLTSVTVSAPYGAHGETPRTTSYEYGAGHQHRLLTKETLGDPADGYTTSYSYGFHDRLDTVTDCNGKKTLHSASVLGTADNMLLPDGTERKGRTLWARNSPYAPPDAAFYTWSKSTGGATVMTFHHKTGAVLRNVTFDLNGNPVFTDRKYNTDGLLEKESLPYRMDAGAEDIRWSVYHYDSYDRLDRIDRPDGSATGFIYDGLTTSTTTTPPPGSPDMTPRRTSQRLNALGWLVESVDEGGASVFSEYFPDGRLKWTQIGADESTRISMEYDHAGNRTRLHDPDYCTAWQDLVCAYDAFGQEVIRTTPRQLTSEFTYDFLGRVTERVEQDMDADGTAVSRTTSWQYGETVPQKGLLLSVAHPEQTVAYAYDTCQRVASETEQFPGATPYTTQYTYDRASRTASVTYPSGFTVKQRYNASGYPVVQTDASGKELYRLGGTAPTGQAERFTLGGVLLNTLEYDPERLLLARTETKKGQATVQDLLYDYDGFCNLASRKDVLRNMEETFAYDDMDRLTEVGLNGVCSQAMIYDTYGRMTSKTAGGQPVFSGAVYDQTSKPHAMDKAVTPSGVFPSAPQTVTYTGFDKVLKVKQGGDSLVYTYGYDHQRIFMEEHVGNTVRTKRYVGACEHVTETMGSLTTDRWLTFLSGPTGVYAVVETENGTNTLHYILKDNLGSWTVVTDSDGNVEQRLGYDAWGNLRDPDTWSGSFTGTPMFDRGFTGHEHLQNFGLINMNGRMYDPMMSSFLSVDQYVQSPENSQNFNRYAYCLNNPLRYVDPTGWLPWNPSPGTPHTSDSDYRDIYAYSERSYEPRDFRNPYYEYNMSFYGNMGGLSGGAGTGGTYYGSYGYQTAYRSNSVYNYHFLSTMIALIRNWQNNPSRRAGQELLDAGLKNLTVGELYGDYQGKSGFRNSFYTWTDANGNKHTAETLYEYVGGNASGVWTKSNLPLELYGVWSTMDKANIMAQSLGVPMGTITEGMEMAAKTYNNVPLLKVRSGLTQSQKIAAISKEGTALLKVSKGLGRICAGVSVGISGYQIYNYYAYGGTGHEVLIKGVADVGMVAVGVFGGPVGLGISIGYFVLDLSTDGFGVSYDIKP